MAAQKKDEAPRYKEMRNAKASRDYVIGEKFEAGIALRGTEVKSIRAGQAQINDAFGRCEKGEGVVFLRDGNPVELRGWEHFRG